MMKDQHEKIKTYRDLSQKEIDLINESKEIEAMVNGFIDKLETTGNIQYSSCRERGLAQTNIETGFMYLIKSIAKPERLSK